MKSVELLLNKNILSVIKMGINVLRDFPKSKSALTRLLKQLPRAAKRRNTLRKQNIIVPPVLMVSTTEACNLRCAGCYAQSNCHDTGNKITNVQIDNLLKQAVEAGCSIVLLAGGEPLLSDHWLEAAASRPELLALVFTNGTLLDEKRADWFAENRNIIPLFSVEGSAQMTNARRGAGVAERVENAMRLLSQRSIPFGLSITTGEHNIKDVATLDFLAPFIQLGCRLSIFTEYVPVDEENTDLLVLTENSKQILHNFCKKVSNENNILLIPFPGDETVYNGCLAAGRGFAHVSASGALQPCPFAAYSDKNVVTTSFADAFSSPLFQKIRSESHLLHEGIGGCALRGRVFETEKIIGG